MSLLLNMLARTVRAFLPRSKRLLISWPHSPSPVILEPNKRNSVTVSIVSPSICHEVKGLWSEKPSSWFFEYWVLSQLFYSPLWFSSRDSSSLLSTVRVVSSAYLRLLIFLPAFLIPVCVSFALAFHLMYSAYKQVKQAGWQHTTLMYSFSNFEPVCCFMSGSSCCFLTCIKVSQEAERWSGIPISLRISHCLLWLTHLKDF